MKNKIEQKEGIVFYTLGEVSNRVIVYKNINNKIPFVFVPGWASTTSTWRFFLPELIRFATTYYFETREKPKTVKHLQSITYDIKSMSKDLICFLNEIKSDYVLVGGSIGASTIIQSLNELKSNFKALVLITPNKKLKTPHWFFVIKYLPNPFFMIIKPIILMVIKLTSFGKDGHHIEGLINAMSEANIPTIKESAIALEKMNLSEINLESIDVPTLIINAIDDGIHNSDDSIYFSNLFKEVDTISFNTFTQIHSSKCANKIVGWLNTLYD